jgi:hypothetical protein
MVCFLYFGISLITYDLSFSYSFTHFFSSSIAQIRICLTNEWEKSITQLKENKPPTPDEQEMLATAGSLVKEALKLAQSHLKYAVQKDSEIPTAITQAQLNTVQIMNTVLIYQFYSMFFGAC